MQKAQHFYPLSSTIASSYRLQLSTLWSQMLFLSLHARHLISRASVSGRNFIPRTVRRPAPQLCQRPPHMFPCGTSDKAILSGLEPYSKALAYCLVFPTGRAPPGDDISYTKPCGRKTSPPVLPSHQDRLRTLLFPLYFLQLQPQLHHSLEAKMPPRIHLPDPDSQL